MFFRLVQHFATGRKMMRLDKYLQVTGLIKRRTLSTEACRRGLVKVNQKTAKPTKEVMAGDSIEIFLARRELTVRVLQEIHSNSLKKALRPEYFTIIKDEAINCPAELADFWAQNETNYE